MLKLFLEDVASPNLVHQKIINELGDVADFISLTVDLLNVKQTERATEGLMKSLMKIQNVISELKTLK